MILTLLCPICALYDARSGNYRPGDARIATFESSTLKAPLDTRIFMPLQGDRDKARSIENMRCCYGRPQHPLWILPADTEGLRQVADAQGPSNILLTQEWGLVTFNREGIVNPSASETHPDADSAGDQADSLQDQASTAAFTPDPELGPGKAKDPDRLHCPVPECKKSYAHYSSLFKHCKREHSADPKVLEGLYGRNSDKAGNE